MTGFSDSRSGWRRICAAVLFCAAALALAGAADAAPFVPKNPNVVLERLPPRDGADWDAIRDLNARLAARPDDASTAAALARRYLELNRRSGEPRLVAYAARALARWESDPAPPPEIALERALIAQTEHRFAAARDELSRLVERAPGSTEPWLALAAIDTVQGRYSDAKRSCARLILQDASLAGACLAALQLAMRNPAAALSWLAANLEHAESLDAELAVWLTTLAAETADALGRADEAARYYAAAFAASGHGPSIYLLTSRADFLLRQGRPGAAVDLLENAPPADSVLLRLALAEARLGRPNAARVETLRYRLEVALRGVDTAHAREAAFFALYLENDAHRALPLALANWAVQRELIDERLVLEAAAAAGQPSAAQPVRDWLTSNGAVHGGFASANEGEAQP
jgi:hypothetical protein